MDESRTAGHCVRPFVAKALSMQLQGQPVNSLSELGHEFPPIISLVGKRNRLPLTYYGRARAETLWSSEAQTTEPWAPLVNVILFSLT